MAFLTTVESFLRLKLADRFFTDVMVAPLLAGRMRRPQLEPLRESTEQTWLGEFSVAHFLSERFDDSRKTLKTK